MRWARLGIRLTRSGERFHLGGQQKGLAQGGKQVALKLPSGKEEFGRGEWGCTQAGDGRFTGRAAQVTLSLISTPP